MRLSLTCMVCSDSLRFHQQHDSIQQVKCANFPFMVSIPTTVATLSHLEFHKISLVDHHFHSWRFHLDTSKQYCSRLYHLQHDTRRCLPLSSRHALHSLPIVLHCYYYHRLDTFPWHQRQCTKCPLQFWKRAIWICECRVLAPPIRWRPPSDNHYWKRQERQWRNPLSHPTIIIIIGLCKCRKWWEQCANRRTNFAHD